MQLSQLHAGVAGRPLPIRARQSVACRRPALQVSCALKNLAKESRIGKMPITIPSSVQFNVSGQIITVKAKNLTMSETLPDLLSIEKLDVNTYKISKRENSRRADQLHGLYRSLTNNMVVGVSVGFTRELQLIGVGYRASVSGDELKMNLGYSHDVIMKIPKDLDVKVEKNTVVKVSGHDKVSLGDFCAKVREKRKPEPYKGKGVRYSDEVIRKKEGKRGK